MKDRVAGGGELIFHGDSVVWDRPVESIAVAVSPLGLNDPFAWYTAT